MSLPLRKAVCSPPAIAFIATFLFTLLIQLRSPLVFMIDGPYYIAQYRYLRYTGGMHYPDPPLAFMILYPFEYVTDVVFGSPYLGLKVCVSLMTA